LAKVGIILGSNELSKLTYAGMSAVISTSLGDEVVIFVTMDAVKAFLKNPEVKVNEDSSKYIKESKEDPFSYFKKAKSTGKLKIYACSYASKLYHASKESYNELVDDIVGITSFYLELEGGQIISIW